MNYYYIIYAPFGSVNSMTCMSDDQFKEWRNKKIIQEDLDNALLERRDLKMSLKKEHSACLKIKSEIYDEISRETQAETIGEGDVSFSITSDEYMMYIKLRNNRLDLNRTYNKMRHRIEELASIVNENFNVTTLIKDNVSLSDYSNFFIMEHLLEAGYFQIREVDLDFYETFHNLDLIHLNQSNVFEI